MKDQVVRQQSFHGTVLITGATGFLGRLLVERLSTEGYLVTALGYTSGVSPFNHAVQYEQIDLADATCARKVLTPWRWDAVVNLAGFAPKRPTALPDDYRLLSDHVKINLNVCLTIPPHWSGRFVHISSMSVYGFPQYLPVDENHACKPINVYGAAKTLTEDIVFTLGQKENLDLWVLRLAGLFSETRQTGAIFNFMRAVVQGEPLVISASQPTPWDVLHVADAVEAIVRALRSDFRGPGPINISYGEPVQLETMAELIAQVAQSRSNVQNQTNISHPVFQMDISKARRILNWPPYTLRQRLEQLRIDVISKAGGGNIT